MSAASSSRGGRRPARPVLIVTALVQAAAPLTAGRAASAETVPPPATAEVRPDAAPDAVAVLLRQAGFWSAQQKPDQARVSLQRALRIDPRNADALAALAGLEAAQGDRLAAEAALSRLREAAPQDPRAARLSGAVRVGPVAPEALDEARRLARDGQYDQAVAQYDRILLGNPPPAALAVEYFRALSATRTGWEAARDGLAALVRETPTDLAAQLAYAETLTYREGARADGIARLQSLAQIPAVAAEAAKAWAAALRWLPDVPDSVAPIEAYLAAHPGESDLQAKLEAARNPPSAPDPAGLARVAGFAQLAAGRLADAADSFRQALDTAPDDADAKGGLGLVRLRQHDLAGARTLLADAIAADPDHADRWRPALEATKPRHVGPNPAAALLASGDAAAAERALRAQLAAGDHDPGLSLMLADAQSRQGRLPEAEQTLRGLIARRPGDGRAEVMLATLLDREGRPQDAADLLARAQQDGAGPVVASARAAMLRSQAQAVADPTVRVALLRAASNAAPGEAWVRLDLARALVASGRIAEARAVMAASVGDGAPVDALRAGIIFADETSDPAAAAALLARLPEGARTPDIQAARAQAALRQEIAAAMADDDPATVRERLLALAAARPDPDGARGAAIARALALAGQPDAAGEAIATAAAATSGLPGAAARLAYAGVMLQLGDAASTRHLLAGLAGDATLAPPQRAALAGLRAGLAVRQSDALNEQGRQAAAFDVLAPALAAQPAAPSLNLALARLYQGAKRPLEAQKVAEALLRRNPGDADARQAAVEAAIASGDHARADLLVREGIQLTPRAPQIWLASAALARARGDDETALRALRRARALRALQREQDPAAPQAGPALGVATTLAVLDPQDLAPGGGPAPPLSQPPLSQPPGGLVAAPDPESPETDADGDQVIVRGHMLDTEATDLPPPLAARRLVAGTPAAYPPSPFAADTRPPRAVVMGAAVASPEADAGPDASRADTAPVASPPGEAGPFGRVTPPPRVAVNPFRPADPAPDSGSVPMQSAAPLLADLGAPATPADPMTARIDRDIAALTDEVSPSAQAAAGFRGRSGSAGTSQLAEITVPLETSFSDGTGGRITLAVTPTFLDAGSLAQGAASQAQFGSLALGPHVAGSSLGRQSADGTGLDARYATGNVSADIGSTPLGFRQENVVGGLEWAPTLGDGVRLRLTGERRAVTDSLLSYAGARDPQSGETFGGVTYARGHANLEFSAGPADLYVGGGGGVLDGRHVKSNTEFEAGAGGSLPVWTAPGQDLRLGLDLVYFSYAKNLGGFTLGQGGYFSPQSYVAALFPVTFKAQPSPNLSYEIGATVGVQSYHQNSSSTFPNDSSLQAALEAQQANPATAVSGVTTAIQAKNLTGFSGGAHALIDYRLTSAFHVGAKVDYEHAGDFNQTVGLLYGRYVFEGGAR